VVAISRNFTECNEIDILQRTNYSDVWWIVFRGEFVVDKLVFAKKVKRVRKGKDPDEKNDRKPFDIIKDLEDNVDERCKGIDKLHVVESFCPNQDCHKRFNNS